ncbi:SDR family oxidoreductase [Amycolatopsis sp. CA-230715]|uniref:SDR family oxidoreductase n=1 Tax=Amycolatopsis sp. CA-230715 TaxID=2745196 RepID=UPI001C01E99D|nr:SDR family oxidoreductase [Amycolatopsis sp. CA-230715]QWF85004.1 3-oxoacyl-[acyl-carrier-protein] reductase FabG [Amycolatopsis sp. CA-230715]
MPVALVTGANRGIGKETARQLVANGMAVLLGSRDPGLGEAAAKEVGAHAVRIDVTDPATVRAVADRIRADHGGLDVLVNNAGAIAEGVPAALTAAQVRDTFEVNVFGVVTTTNAMLPLLRAAAAPRVVNVSSTTGSLALTSAGTDFGGDADRRMAYASSKAALNMLTIQYARAFANDPGLAHIRVNAATPGFTATEMNGHRGTRTVAEGARVIVDLALAEEGPTGGFFNDKGPVPW